MGGSGAGGGRCGPGRIGKRVTSRNLWLMLLRELKTSVPSINYFTCLKPAAAVGAGKEFGGRRVWGFICISLGN